MTTFRGGAAASTFLAYDRATVHARVNCGGRRRQASADMRAGGKLARLRPGPSAAFGNSVARVMRAESTHSLLSYHHYPSHSLSITILSYVGSKLALCIEVHYYWYASCGLFWCFNRTLRLYPRGRRRRQVISTGPPDRSALPCEPRSNGQYSRSYALVCALYELPGTACS